jgi:hypothetical protein
MQKYIKGLVQKKNSLRRAIEKLPHVRNIDVNILPLFV